MRNIFRFSKTYEHFFSRSTDGTIKLKKTSRNEKLRGRNLEHFS